jgi:hypothetical protein
MFDRTHFPAELRATADALLHARAQIGRLVHQDEEPAPTRRPGWSRWRNAWRDRPFLF